MNATTELKAQPGGDVGIIGSVSLVRSLHAAGLTDRYTLLICPLTLGSGARLFEGPPRGPSSSSPAGAAVVTAAPTCVASGASGAGSTPP